MVKSRTTIVIYTKWLNFTTSLMVVYSICYFIMKLFDFASLQEREDKLRKETKLPERAYRSMYYQINYLSLIISVLSVFATIYIKLTLRKNKIFNKTVYQKFIAVCFCAIMVVLFLFSLVIVSFI